MTKVGGTLLIAAGIVLIGISFWNLPLILMLFVVGIVLVEVGAAFWLSVWFAKPKEDAADQPVRTEPDNTAAGLVDSPTVETEGNPGSEVYPSSLVDAGEALGTQAEKRKENDQTARRRPRIKGFVYYQGSGEYLPLIKDPIKVEFDRPQGGKAEVPKMNKPQGSNGVRAGQPERSKAKVATAKYWSFPIDPNVDPKELDLKEISDPGESRVRPSFAVGSPENDLVGESKAYITE